MHLINNSLENICVSKFEFKRVIFEYLILCIKDNIIMSMIKGSGHSGGYDYVIIIVV